MIQQNTPEWLELRKNKIGASDAPIILGDSPWKTPYQLWEEKLGLRPQPSMNDAMRRGHELEPIARQAYNDHTGNCVEPEVLFHKEHEWMMASLDGVSLDRSIVVEIKCPGEKDHQAASDGKVPDKYYAQLQHQLAVINLNLLHYFSYRDGDFHLIVVERDEKYIENLYSEEVDFWKKMQDFQPPELSNRDYVQKKDEGWLQTAQNWASVSTELKSLKDREKVYRESLIQMSMNRNSQGGGVKVQKIIRKGSVDYKDIPELSGVDLEEHRKEPIESWRITS